MHMLHPVNLFYEFIFFLNHTKNTHRIAPDAGRVYPQLDHIILLTLGDHSIVRGQAVGTIKKGLCTACLKILLSPGMYPPPCRLFTQMLSRGHPTDSPMIANHGPITYSNQQPTKNVLCPIGAP